MRSIIWVLFMMFQLSYQRTVLYETINYNVPKVIDQELNIGETIEITYNVQNSFIIIIGNPKFYINIEFNGYKYHYLKSGIYALGDKGKAYYTALEAGKHKFLAWSTSSTHCMHIVAYGKQNHIKTRPIKPRPFAFVETDPNVKMTVQADKLISGDWVFPFINGKFEEYGAARPSFDLEVDCLVKVNQANGNAVDVTITSNGNSLFDYGEYDASELAVPSNSVPFIYIAENKKENALNNFHDPSEQEPPDQTTSTGSTTTSSSTSTGSTSAPSDSTNTGSTSTSTGSTSAPSDSTNTGSTSAPTGSSNTGSTSSQTHSPSSGIQKPDNGDDSSGKEKDGGLSTGELAGVGTGVAAGVTGIIGSAFGIYKKIKSKSDNSKDEDDDGKNVNKNVNNINNNNNINLSLNFSSDPSKGNFLIQQSPPVEEL
ncbi:hypothetical protein M9Y10_021370 [Tritrichomonas musculus]|uniref:Uncharacterized protein n=1 Tax=Tritrichomonas musculus TaxID=1915356 RepID=A0ABR2HDT1_9EUKA